MHGFYSTWPNFNHVFLEESEKDNLKAAFGYTAVPFYVIFDKEGKIVVSGDGKSFDISTELQKLVSGGLNFNEDF